jgi:hypothetical protein
MFQFQSSCALAYNKRCFWSADASMRNVGRQPSAAAAAAAAAAAMDQCVGHVAPPQHPQHPQQQQQRTLDLEHVGVVRTLNHDRERAQ